MERWVGRVALVTGASSGIGAAIAGMLVKHGMKVVGCARNVDKIEELSKALQEENGSLVGLQCDLRKEEDIVSMFGQIKKKYGGVDVCINNAGLATSTPLLSGATEGLRNMFEVNVLALCICTREAVQSMQERNIDDGHIIHINSISGHRVVSTPDGNGYIASKHAVTALTEGHRNELRHMKSHIRVSAISPGLVETDFAYRMKGPEKAQELYSRIKNLTADDIANAVEYVMSAPQHVQVHDLLIRPTEQAS